jgi:hypothetical protein
MTSAPAPRKAVFNSGWILVTGLLTLCVLGTWQTMKNFRLQILCSTSAVVLENQWPQSRISATFPVEMASQLRVGQDAKITIGTDKKLIPGRVLKTGLLSIGSGTNVNVATIAVTDSGEGARSDSDKVGHYLPAGAPCSVTVDTSIPADATAAPSPQH